MLSRYLLVCSLLGALLVEKPVAQPVVVQPGPNFTLSVDGAPFFPFGWNALGNCPDARGVWDEETLRSDIERLRSHGINVVTEPPAADGRVIPLVLRSGHENWYSYRATRPDGRIGTIGHPKPGAYAAGLLRYMNLAYGTGEAPIYLIPSIMAFVTPQGWIPDEWTQPFAGSDTLRCDEYRRFIERERRQLATGGEEELARLMTGVNCPRDPLPFWEWNLRYIVHSLRDHPGLLAWFLWDEPEDVGHRHFFSAVLPEEPVPPYTGPESLPTPDLLRHVYERVIEFEEEERPAGYSRRPIVVDIANPDLFFSNRFPWSQDGQLRPRENPGPFDRRPDGGYTTPADILGIEASASMVYTQPRGERPAQAWFRDQNDPVWKSSMLRDALETDGLWSATVIAGQAQLASVGPYRPESPTRCTGYVSNVRLLNDRDLVWHLLSLQITGMRGQIYFSQHLMPAADRGAAQVARTNHLIQQYRAAQLDSIMALPPLQSGWALQSVQVHALTSYFRSDPAFIGSADTYDPGPTAARQFRGQLDPGQYALGSFGRTSFSKAYGHATVGAEAVRPGVEGYMLLRATARYVENDVYLLISNIFDARITATLVVEEELDGDIVEGVFNLGPGGDFEWISTPDRVETQPGPPSTYNIQLEPYEARILRLRK